HQIEYSSGTGSNTAADHIRATRLALAQLPARLRQVLIRADSGGGTQEFLAWLAKPGRRLAYSVGFTITEEIAGAILTIPAPAWTPASTTQRARCGPARGSPRSPACWTCRPGRRASGSSSAKNARTPARSCGSPTPAATGSPASPPAPRAGSSLTWNSATGAGPGARTGSAAPRTPA